jgi:hypothetical protein
MTWTLGNTFVRLGHLEGVIDAVNTFAGTTIPAKVATLLGDYSGETGLTAGVYSSLASWQSLQKNYLRTLDSLANAIILNDVNVSRNIPNRNVMAGIAQLIAEMVANAQTVNKCTVSSSVTPAGGNTGTPVILSTLLHPTGRYQENAVAESVGAACTNDAQSGSAVAGQESIRFAGQILTSDSLSYLWPSGSGCSKSFVLAGPANSLISNGNFETFTVANIPDSFHINVGTAGTTILKSTGAGTFYDGVSSLEFVGNSSELTEIYQTFGTDNATAIRPFAQYAFNTYLKMNSATASGVLEVALTDASGAIVADSVGNPNAFTVTLSTVSNTAFVPVSGIFRLPRVLPTAIRLRIRLTTTLPTGNNLYIDRAVFSGMSSLYLGGPYVACFSSAVNPIRGDAWTLAVANDYAGKIQRMFDRFFGMAANDLILPSSASPTISDSLVS